MPSPPELTPPSTPSLTRAARASNCSCTTASACDAPRTFSMSGVSAGPVSPQARLPRWNSAARISTPWCQACPGSPCPDCSASPGHEDRRDSRHDARALTTAAVPMARHGRVRHYAVVVMSLVQSADVCHHKARAYLCDVLQRLPTQLSKRIEKLLPHRCYPAGVEEPHAVAGESSERGQAAAECKRRRHMECREFLSRHVVRLLWRGIRRCRGFGTVAFRAEAFEQSVGHEGRRSSPALESLDRIVDQSFGRAPALSSEATRSHCPSSSLTQCWHTSICT